MTYYPPKQCPICRDLFTPCPTRGQTNRLVETCGKSRCRALLGARTDNWRAGMTKAAATLKAQKEARMQARLAGFAPLTERELQILTVVRKLFYQDGYNAAVVAKSRAQRRSVAS